jgi:hypothetical protein
MESWSINFSYFHAAVMLLFYIIQRITMSEFCYFPKIYNHTSLYGPGASGASVDATSQICSSAMLVLPIVGN